MQTLLTKLHPLKQKYWLISAIILVVYIVGAITLTIFFPFPQTGAGDFGQPALENLDLPPQPELIVPSQIVKSFCITSKTPVARVIFIYKETNYPVYAVYCIGTSGPTDNSMPISNVGLFNAISGEELREGSLYRQLGMWKYFGYVKSLTDWVMGGFALVALFILGYVELQNRAYQIIIEEPKMSKIGTWGYAIFIIFSILLPCATIPIGLLIGKRYRLRAYTVLNIWLGAFLAFLLLDAGMIADFWGLWAIMILAVTMWSMLLFGSNEMPEVLTEAFPSRSNSSPKNTNSFPQTNQPASKANVSQLPLIQETIPEFKVIAPKNLPNFSDVGGMESLKKEIRDSIGLMLAFRDEAETYKISWNGFLLHGPPGAGKTFIAQAIAGEFGINFIPVSPSELTSSYLGGSARLIANLFNFAHEYTPCIVFFDEFDSLAVEREGGIDPERRLIVNQLLRSLEEVRKEQELIVIAATNELELLDPAIIRPGRFDYHIHIGYPDQEARRAILSTQLAEIPVAADLDLNDIARRLDGSSAADVASIVRKTALNVFREKVQLDHESTAVITQKDLLKTLSNRSGRDRPKVGPTSWDELILPMETKEELMEIEKIIENQDLADKLGIDPPNGVLLYGPPGTGKTTIAKVLASETRASFYLISAADILTKWFGESERKIKKLFERARRNRPSIIFIDEIDALAPRRTGLSGVQDTIVNQLLNEIDGMSTQPGVFVIGATNRPDTLDPALLRGGRLSRQIQIPLPDPKCRAQLLHLMTADMPLAKNINLAAYIELTDGFSGADIETFCQEAAQEAFNRLHLSGEPQSPIIETQDFDKALIEHKQHRYNQGDK